MSQSARLALIGALSVVAANVQAETTLCTEIVPPMTITTPGIYCLFKDYALNLPSGAAITVNANNVVIDFNGHRIGNAAAGTANGAIGVKGYNASIQGYQNITVRNGTIRGFNMGIYLYGSGSQGHLIEDMLVDQSLKLGLGADGQGTVIRRNRVFGTGVTSTLGDFATGLFGNGAGMSVTDNVVLNTKAGTEAFGMQVSGTGVVSGNRVIDVGSASGSNEFGIWVYGTSIVVSDNRVADSVAAVGATTYGILAHPSSISVKMVGNVVNVVGTAYSGGTQVPGTNH